MNSKTKSPQPTDVRLGDGGGRDALDAPVSSADSDVTAGGDRPRIRLSAYVPATDDGQPPRGIVCRKCGCSHFFVVYTRPIPGGIRRSRQCRNCGRRQITNES